MDLVGAVLALLIGLAVGWWVAQRQSAAVASGQAARVADAQSRADSLAIANLELQAQASSLHSEVAGLQATLTSERELAREREALHARTEQQLRETFATLSAEALQKNNEAFVQLAEARLAKTAATADGQLAQRQQAIAHLQEQMMVALKGVEEQQRSAERGRHASEAALREQLDSMRAGTEQVRSETAQLVNALRAPQVRGRWGEMQLERIIEAAGLTEHVDYVTQATSTTADGTLRPDLVVKLVGSKQIVVDSKVPFSGYLEAMEAKDEATRDNRLKAHARHLRTHVDSLAAKAYWERFAPTPEFVVCFVPADAFLDAALREDATLQEHAWDRNVILATPSTLVALLRTIGYAWRQEALAKNAEDVRKLGKELYQRLSTLGGHFEKLGKSLGTAVGHYNTAIGSLEGRVFVTARKMAELGVVDAGTDIKALEQVTETTRPTAAPEYADQKLVALPKPRVAPGQSELPVAEASGG